MDIKIYFLLAVFCISSTNAIHQLEEWKQWNFSRVEQQQTDIDVITVITLCGQTSKFAVRLPEAYLQSAGRSYAVDFSCFKENTFGLTNLRRPHEMINPNWNQDEICKFFETKLFPDFCKIKRSCPGNSAPSAKFGDYYGYAKMFLHSLSLLISVFGALMEVLSNHDGKWREHGVHTSSDIIFNVFTLTTYSLCLRFGHITNAFLHVSWILRSVSLIPLNLHLANLVFSTSSLSNVVLFAFSLTHLICGLILCVLFWHPDVDNTRYERLNEKPPNPKTVCSAAQLFFWDYVLTLLRKSHKNTITYDDYWQLERRNQVSFIRTKISPTYPASYCAVIWLMFKCSWVNVMMSLFHGLVVMLMRFSNCVCIWLILEVNASDYPLWLKLVIGLAPVLVDAIRIIYRQKFFFRGRMGFYNISSMFSSMIFDKMLRLSPQNQTQTAVGVIMNHVTVDLIRVRTFWAYFKDFFMSPLQISISMAILSTLVGFWPTVYGTSVLVVFMFANVIVTRFAMKFYKTQMSFKDDRLKLLNDVLNGIRVLKLYGWEQPIQKMILAIRAKEINEMRKNIFFNAFLDGSFSLGPVVATVATFYGFVVVENGHMTPKIAFMTLFLFDSVRVSINFLPQLFISTVTAFVSMKRLMTFLGQEERPLNKLGADDLSDVDGGDVVAVFDNTSFSWSGTSSELTLHPFSAKIRRGQLVGVIGSVGAGKSTLIQTLIGELQPVSGDLKLDSKRVAYVPQQAWIQNLTLQKNVLFDSDMNVDYYNNVLEACALNQDLELLKYGDLTEIGEKGVNLSGGQKARVSLARAVFHQADFYAIDDPFSAVDSHVAEHLFSEVVGPNGLLKQTTRVVALNSTKFLPQFDWILCLKDGKLTHSGTFSQLATDPSSPIAALHSNASSTSRFEKTSTQTSLIGKFKRSKKEQKPKDKPEEDKLVQDENLSYGRVSKSIYLDYFRAYGFWNFAVLTPLIFFVTMLSNAMANVYLAGWSSSMQTNGTSSFKPLEIYGFLGVGGFGLYFVAYTILYWGAYRAARVLHRDMIQSIMRASMSFFDQTPIGRIINRFSSDMETVDGTLGMLVGNSFNMLEEVAYSLTGIFIALPWLLPILIPMASCFFYIVRFFNAATAQYRRMGTSAVSQVCSTIQDAYIGATSIRCYGSIRRFQDLLNSRLDRVSECYFVEQAVGGWIRTVLCFISNTAMLVFIMVGISMANADMITLGLLALIINSSFTLNNVFGSIAEIYRVTETEIVSVERIKEYIALENEGVWKLQNKGMAILTEAPSSKIEFRNVSLRYRKEDQPVLHDLSFCVEAGQKIGIVGRTGAGKTSITSVLFRLVEPFQGEIQIGGVDIKRFGTNLRRILTIIPQDPVLFCGSLRANLDPFDEYPDERLWSALEKANLYDHVQTLNNGLDYEITDGGSNLSVGQRQLICLARALLRATSILVLDEATSSVDHATDKLIQETIRKEFHSCTIITIAHRLETIMDYDKVLVMESGRLSEFDSVENLLAKQDGLFRGFAQKAGLA
ncbi:Multidrug resistance-associated protein 1 isoform X5 [Aphelenchoides bicaudatus]|nr:Multidrug resistance-associated protein 1 isoform X5 [Aphelenchoides bicaudatus]